MIMGTASDVGKSMLAAGLCRIFYRSAVRVAPFKAQNMSLNSFVTIEGGEIGRSQALQAQACGLVPHVDMNPILLKPEGDRRCQVIVHGTVLGSREPSDDSDYKPDLFRFVQESYERLAGCYDLIVIEGAGSAAEMNLRDRDIVNWPVAQMADAKVLLVADIDRGGVFAQVIGTLDLLSPQERKRVFGAVVNRFRGDLRLFADGIGILQSRTGVPVLGTVPFVRNLELDQEDSLEIELASNTHFTSPTVNIAITLLPFMSNFTDFNALAAEPDVALRYAAAPLDLASADIIILPGSKNTIADLDYLKQSGFFGALNEHVHRGGELVGICGGYQMLGREISDPHGLEAGGNRDGIGLLDIATELSFQKRTVQVEAIPLHLEAGSGCAVSGYEIHMGVTRRGDAAPSFRILGCSDRNKAAGEGAVSKDGRVWGTCIHGVFDRPEFRRLWLNRARQRKGLAALEIAVSRGVTMRLASALDRWADHLEKHLDVSKIFVALGL